MSAISVRLSRKWRINDWVRASTKQAFVYTIEELARMLADVGFDDFDAFGDIDLTPFDDESARVIVRCRRS